MPEFVFELLIFKSKRDSNNRTAKITIKDTENGKIIQEIFPSEFTSFGSDPTYYKDGLIFIIEDMNFECYADIRIQEYLPAGPNVPFVCWVWDKETGQYVYDSALSDVPSLGVDYENELIWADGRSSASEHFTVYYRYIEGVLTLIKEVRSGFLDENDSNQGYAITYE